MMQMLLLQILCWCGAWLHRVSARAVEAGTVLTFHDFPDSIRSGVSGDLEALPQTSVPSGLFEQDSVECHLLQWLLLTFMGFESIPSGTCHRSLWVFVIQFNFLTGE